MTRVAQLELLSRYDNIELAERMLAEVCQSSSLTEEAVYWSGMALREALANAIKHGNKLSPDKRVFVRIEVNGSDELKIAVEDQGQGFDPSGIDDPLAPQNLMRESGRGVFYMRNFMDEVRFVKAEGGGTRIELIKRVSKGGRNEESDS
jgi:serine/threonine-protein kinase RsbW